jgi:hypothetical protein
MLTLPKLFLGAFLGTSIAFLAHSVCPAQTSPQQATLAQCTDAEKQPDASAKPTQPRPNPDACGKYHVGDGVTPPKLVHTVEPEVPRKFENYDDSAYLIALTVGIDGKPIDVHVPPPSDTNHHKPNKSEMELQDIAVQTVKQYRFTPATYQGTPVPVQLNIEFHFQRYYPRPY